MIASKPPPYARFLRCRRGATAVEFAAVGAPFLALVVAILQTGLVYLSQAALETTTDKVSRLVLTGSAQGSALSQSGFLAAACAKLPALLSCANLMVDVRTYASFAGTDTSLPVLTFSNTGAVSNTWTYVTGGPGDIVVLRVLYQLPVVGGPLNFALANLSNGNRLLMATAVFKNEPYQ